MSSDELNAYYKLYLTEEEQNYRLCKTLEDLNDIIDDGENDLGNLVILNCFWQLEEPLAFLKALEMRLKSGASAVFIEPLLSPVSFLWATQKHGKRLDHKAKPFNATPRVNFATPSLLFDRIENRIQMMHHFPNLTFDTRQRHNLLTKFAGSSGKWLPTFKKADDFLMPFLGNFAASQMKVVLSKKG